MGRHPWPLSLAARRPAHGSARARAPAGTPSRRRASRQPIAGPGRAGGKLGARPRAPPAPPAVRPGVRSGRRPWSRSLRFLRASSLVSIVYDLGYTIPYNGLRRAYRGTPIAANASRREHEPRTYTARGTIFSHLCTQGVHRRLSTFEYARPRSAWISHDYIPPPAANTLQSR
jgi:hypothetical protein